MGQLSVLYTYNQCTLYRAVCVAHFIARIYLYLNEFGHFKKSKRKVQGVPQSQTAALPRHQKEEETDKSKQAQIETNVQKVLRLALYPQAR